MAFLWSTTNAANMATIAAEFQQQVAVGFKGNPSRGRQDVNPTLRFAHHVAKGTPMDLNGAGGIPALGFTCATGCFQGRLGPSVLPGSQVSAGLSVSGSDLGSPWLAVLMDARHGHDVGAFLPTWP